ncbi:MAG: hypothetical protein MI924_00545 [Chloroflexales bacterium]|nr:hypothetical protein [Chloroflexales bacterium]
MKLRNENLPHLLADFDKGVNPKTEPELLFAFLRQRGCSKVDCIQALILRYNYSLQIAKKAVHLSQTWQNRQRQDDAFHKQLEQCCKADDPEDS